MSNINEEFIYKINKTKSWLYSIDLYSITYENWYYNEEFIKNITHWLEFRNSNEYELENWLYDLQNIKEEDIVEELKKIYHQKYFWEIDDFWLVLWEWINDLELEENELVNKDLFPINVDNIIDKIRNSNKTNHDKILDFKKLFLDMIIQCTIYENDHWEVESNRWFLQNVFFSWWTCINRCYFWNYRFSEDLDFFYHIWNFDHSMLPEIIRWIKRNMRKLFKTEKFLKEINFNWLDWFEPNIEIKSFWAHWWKFILHDEIICWEIKKLSYLDELWKTNSPDSYIQLDFSVISWVLYNPVEKKEKRKVEWFFIDIDWYIFCQSRNDIVKSKQLAFLNRWTDRDFIDISKFKDFWTILDKEVEEKMKTFEIKNEKEIYHILTSEEFESFKRNKKI